MKDEILKLNIKNILERYGFNDKEINKLVGNVK